MGQRTRKRAATATLPLSLEVFGVANGAPLEVVGRGRLDPGRRRCELVVAAAHGPLDLDPVLVVLASVDTLLLPLLGLKPADPDVPAVGHGSAVVVDEDGRLAGSIVTTAVIQASQRELRARVQVRSCDVAMEPGETISSAEQGRVQVSVAGDAVTVAPNWAVETTRGRTYRLAGLRHWADMQAEARAGSGLLSVQTMLGCPHGGAARRTLRLALDASL